MKRLIYDDSFIDSFEDLVARISVAVDTIREMSGIFVKVPQSLHRQFEECVTGNGSKSEQLL